MSISMSHAKCVPSSCPGRPATRGTGKRWPKSREARETHACNDDAPIPHSTKQQAKVMNERICSAARAGDAEALLNLAAADMGEMTCVNLSTLLHKLAWLRKNPSTSTRVNEDDRRMLALISQIRLELERQQSQSEATPRCWATMAWAYGSLQFDDFEVAQSMRIISQLSRVQVTSFKPLELTNLLWGFAKVQNCDELLFLAAKSHIEVNVDKFTAGNLATIMWACATVKFGPNVFMQYLAGEFVSRFPSEDVWPGHISNMLWSLATLKSEIGPAYLDAVAVRAVKILHAFKIQELSITAWAISRMHSRQDLFFKAVADLFMSDSMVHKRLHPQGAANLLWAFEKQASMSSKASVEIEGAVRVLLPTCHRLLPELKQEEFTCMLLSIAGLGVKFGESCEADAFFMSALRAAQQHVNRFSSRDCENILGALATFVQGQATRSQAFPHALPELVHICLVRVQQVHFCSVGGAEYQPGEEHSRQRAFVQNALEVVTVSSVTPLLRKQLLMGIARHALQCGPGLLTTTAQAQLADLCSLRDKTLDSGEALCRAAGLCPQHMQHEHRLQNASMLKPLSSASLREDSSTAELLVGGVGEPQGSCNALKLEGAVEKLTSRRAADKSDRCINLFDCIHTRGTGEEATWKKDDHTTVPVQREQDQTTQSGSSGQHHDVASEAAGNLASSCGGEEDALGAQTSSAQYTVVEDYKGDPPHAQLEYLSAGDSYHVKNTFIEITSAEEHHERRRLSAKRFSTEIAQRPTMNNDSMKEGQLQTEVP